MDNVSVHTIEPYGRRLLIATITSDKELTEIEEKYSVLNELKQLGGVYGVIHEGWNALLIIFNFNTAQTLTYGMIAHEAMHIVDEIFHSIGHDYDVENNEPGTYLIEWIVNQIFKHMKERKLLNKLSYESKVEKLPNSVYKIISKNLRKI